VLLKGDCRQQLVTLPDNSIDSIITDPPYELGFMGKTWDSTGIAYNTEVWQQCLRVLKPGGHLLAFGGSRTYHRLACAIEDAGFQIRDQIMWVYGSGFPKSLNISKAIDKAGGAEREVIGYTDPHDPRTAMARSIYGGEIQEGAGLGNPITAPATAEAKQWEGWGTALKPAHEPIVLARKPLDGTVANNVLTHGVGGINIDGCRVGDEVLGGGTMPNLRDVGAMSKEATGIDKLSFGQNPRPATRLENQSHVGRFPANFIHDGSDEVLELFPDSKGGAYPAKRGQAVNTAFASGQETEGGFRKMGDIGSAARFFYCAKANKTDRNEGLDGMPLQRRAGLVGADRDGELDDVSERWRTQPAANHHPTVKPTTLMRYLCRLVTPPGGTILDPFTGSGSTGKAAVLEGFNFIGIELDPDYIAIAEARIQHAYNQHH
jgi:DNA modification methylase